jgi:AAA ATPase-like protein
MAESPEDRLGAVPDLPRGPAPVVGRRHQLEVLERGLGEVVAGAPRVVLLAGEAGVGKSRLVKELRERAVRRDVQVLYGRCSEDLPLPYLPFVEALAPVLRTASGDESAVLDRLLHPNPSSPDEGGSSAPGAEQLQRFRTVAHACISAAQERATLLVLEDLHWADRSTLDLLQHVVFTMADAASRSAVPLLLALTYRAGEVGDRLARAIDRLRREDVTRTIEVPGLDEVEIDALIRHLTRGEPTHQLVTTISEVTQWRALLARLGAVRHPDLARGGLQARRVQARLRQQQRSRPAAARSAPLVGVHVLMVDQSVEYRARVGLPRADWKRSSPSMNEKGEPA